LAGFKQLDRRADLTVREDGSATAEVLSCPASFRDGVAYSFTLDLELHLSQRRHDGEHHRPHRRRGIHVPAAEVENAKAGALASQLLGEPEHVDRGPTEPVEGRHDESVAVMQRA
jgi:hypothetical protein